MDALPILKFVVVEHIPYALAVMVIALVAQRAGTRVLGAVSERFTTRRLLVKQVSAVLRFAIVLLASVLVIGSVFQLTDEVLLALGGSAAVAIGFAFKDLLASLMAGVILLFDRPFQVGDRVEFGGAYGEVLEIGLRTVRIRTLDDNVVSIPNHLFLNESVSCANTGELHQLCVIDFYLGCDQDFDTAKEIIYEATASSRFAFLRAPISVTVLEGPVPNGGERLAVRVRSKAYVFDGRYENAFSSDVMERVKRELRRRGIHTAGDLEWIKPAAT